MNMNMSYGFTVTSPPLPLIALHLQLEAGIAGAGDERLGVMVCVMASSQKGKVDVIQGEREDAGRSRAIEIETAAQTMLCGLASVS